MDIAARTLLGIVFGALIFIVALEAWYIHIRLQRNGTYSRKASA